MIIINSDFIGVLQVVEIDAVGELFCRTEIQTYVMLHDRVKTKLTDKKAKIYKTPLI